MGPIVAISDDLTGALGLSILMKNQNLPTVALASYDSADSIRPQAGVTVINVDTRRASPGIARKRVGELVARVPPHSPIAKRFDTTLRGHLALELDTVLEARPQSRALVVPAYPSGGRTTVGGYQLLNGLPLERTEAATDPEWPVTHSYVPAFFHRAHSVGHVTLHEVNSGADGLLEKLTLLFAEHRIVVVDAVTDLDIENIARAAARLEGETIPVSPGVFLSSYIRTLYDSSHGRFIVAVLGTPTHRTRVQIEKLANRAAVCRCQVDVNELDSVTPETVFERFVESFEPADCDVLVVEPVGPRRDTLGGRIVEFLSDVGNRFLSTYQSSVSGLLLSGGDTAATVLARVGATRIQPEVEFGSLVMGGRILDGLLKGMKLTTKGGLVGDENTFVRAFTWFNQHNGKDDTHE